jgi:hypothetical protein
MSKVTRLTESILLVGEREIEYEINDTDSSTDESTSHSLNNGNWDSNTTTSTSDEIVSLITIPQATREEERDMIYFLNNEN